MDKWDEQAAALLPCKYPGPDGCGGFPHNRLCPAYYRPAVAAALREARALLEESAVSIGGNWRDRRDKWLAAQADKARGGK